MAAKLPKKIRALGATIEIRLAADTLDGGRAWAEYDKRRGRITLSSAAHDVMRQKLLHEPQIGRAHV